MAFSTINKSTDYFNTKLYSGTGSSQNITGVGFQPDWTWVKSRTNAEAHVLRDAVRGNYRLNTASTGAQDDASTAVSGFVSDGFTVVTADAVNNSSQTYASWNWKANGSGSANTVGDIASTVSVNTTSGFSIVSYTGTGVAGATIGHGLGVVPAMIIVKCLSATQPWRVYHASLGATYALILNNTIAKDDDNTAWNDTEPTSSVFSAGTTASINGSGSTYVAYCFAEISGYSKFSSYTGNANADGTFVYTGFKPSFVMIKASSYTGDWTMADNKRLGYNARNDQILANTTSAEANTVAQSIDILSNGFKCRGTGTNTNGAYTYIYMAFGQPIISNSGVCATAY